jgi:parallel beta-helix repeat protein
MKLRHEISPLMNMRAKPASMLILLLLASCLLYSRTTGISTKASDGLPVHNLDSHLNYASIQAAIDAPETLNGHRIFVDAGTYVEHVTVNKQISLSGANCNTTKIDGGNTDVVIHVVAANVQIMGFTVTKGAVGILAENSDNVTISDNVVIENVDAIVVRYSHNCIVHGNVAGSNAGRGILVTNCQSFTVTENQVFFNSMYGLNANASTNGLIALNTAYNNSYDGIGLLSNSSNCIIAGNTARNNPSGILLEVGSINNSVYDNNIVQNWAQARSGPENSWNNTVEGNYWSDYSGLGFDSDNDGIGDWGYETDSGLIVDHYPLLGRFSDFEPYPDRHMGAVSNSTINSFDSNKTGGTSTITFHVSNATVGQTGGFCRIRLPHSLLAEPFNVTVDGANPAYWKYDVHDDGDSRWIYFSYNHSTHEIVIRGTTPEAPPTIVVSSPRNVAYSTNNIPLTFSVDEPTFWMGYSLDGHANVTMISNTTLVSVAEGVHSLTVYANDTAGNMGSATVAFTVDMLPPYIVIVSPANESYRPAFRLNFTVNEPTAWVRYSLDDQANVTITGNITLPSLAEGPHSLRVYASDQAGNVGASSLVHFSIDTTSPTVTILSPENKTYSSTTVPLSFVVSEPISLAAYVLDNGTMITTLVNLTLNGLSNGVHNVTVRLFDRAGNTGVSEIVFFTVEDAQQGTLVLDPLLVGAVIATVVIALVLLVYFVKFRKRASTAVKL